MQLARYEMGDSLHTGAQTRFGRDDSLRAVMNALSSKVEGIVSHPKSTVLHVSLF
jgi:hypothetical protein